MSYVSGELYCYVLCFTPQFPCPRIMCIMNHHVSCSSRIMSLPLMCHAPRSSLLMHHAPCLMFLIPHVPPSCPHTLRASCPSCLMHYASCSLASSSCLMCTMPLSSRPYTLLNLGPPLTSPQLTTFVSPLKSVPKSQPLPSMDCTTQIHPTNVIQIIAATIIRV
jgi:hypothetical protein